MTILIMTNKLNDPRILLNQLLYDKMFPTTPFFVHVKFVSHFRTKANLINIFFALICTKMKNASGIPSHAQ